MHGKLHGVICSYLNENQIPDLQNIGVIHVHQVGCISTPHPVVVDFSARPTRPLVAHLPEVILGTKGQNSFCWQELQPANTKSPVQELSSVCGVLHFFCLELVTSCIVGMCTVVFEYLPAEDETKLCCLNG